MSGLDVEDIGCSRRVNSEPFHLFRVKLSLEGPFPEYRTTPICRRVRYNPRGLRPFRRRARSPKTG